MKTVVRWIMLIVVLGIAGCATAETRTPDDASKTLVPVLKTPEITSVEPVSLPVEAVAWGASVLGKSEDIPFSISLAPAAALDSKDMKALPQDVQDAIAAARKTNPQAWLILLYGGAQPSPSYSIQIDEISLENKNLSLSWHVQAPSSATGGAMVMAYPYVVLALTDVELETTQVEYSQ